MSDILYHVARQGQQRGPYSFEQVQEMIRSGEINGTDMMWHEGLAAWQPASVVMGSAQFTSSAAPPPPPQGYPYPPHAGELKSWMGITSLIIGGVMVIAWFTLLAVAGIASNAGANEQSPEMVIIGLLLFLGIGINFGGAIFGLIPLLQSGHKKGLALAGLCINVLTLLGMTVIIILGLMIQ